MDVQHERTNEYSNECTNEYTNECTNVLYFIVWRMASGWCSELGSRLWKAWKVRSLYQGVKLLRVDTGCN